MNIRPETPQDYSQIADVIYEACAGSYSASLCVEPRRVAALRNGQYYDPELALVAEDEETGRVVGHAFFSFMPSILLGQERYGAILASLAVAPAYQHQGLGGKLLAEGARVAKEKGIAFILVRDEQSDYYAKFGYQPYAFSYHGCIALLEEERDATIQERPVRQSDLPWIIRRWKEIHMNDRLALYPGDLAVQWCSYASYTYASVFTRDDEILGYARYNPVLVNDLVPLERNASAILSYIAGRDEIAVPLLARQMETLGVKARQIVTSSPSHFMLNVAGDPLVTQYLQADWPGIAIFPSAMEID